MAVIAKWNGHKFEVSPSVIRSFTALSFKGSSETEEKTSGGQKYVARKNGKPDEITLTAILDSRLGCDVRKEAVAWADEAREGKTGYFYVCEKKNYYKLTSCKMMLTEASVTALEVMPSGKWLKANVQLTLKQCGGSGSGGTGSSGSGSSGSGSGGSSGAGYNKTSVKSTTPARTYRTSGGKVASRVITTSRTTSAQVSSENKNISALVSKARETTTAQKQAAAVKSRRLVAEAKNLVNYDR